MVRGIPASVMLHAAVIGAGYIVWPYVGSMAAEDEFVIVPVELVDVGELTNVAPVIEPEEKADEPEEEPPVEEPEELEEDVPIEEQPDERDIPEDEIETAQEAAPPEQEDDVMPSLDKEPEAEEKPEPEKPKPETPKTPNPKPKANPLDSLLNDAESTFTSERQTKRKTQAPQPEEKPKVEPQPQQEKRAGAGERTANTVRIEQLLYNQIYPCWDGVGDQPDPSRLNVSMRAEFDLQGNVIDIDLVKPSRAPIGDRSLSLAIERALRAVRKCQPYRLPEDDYDLWKNANINLGPGFKGK